MEEIADIHLHWKDAYGWVCKLEMYFCFKG